jgi:PAS domain S-box-containing protein
MLLTHMMSSFWNIPEFNSRQLLEFLERSLNPICVYDDRRHTVYASQSFLELLHIEVVRPNFFDYFSPSLRKKLAKSWQRARYGELSRFTSRTRDGQQSVECSLAFDNAAKLMFLTAQRFEKNKNFQLTEAYQQAIGQSAQDHLATALINTNGDVIQCNQNFHILLGTNHQEELNLEHFMHPEDRFNDEQLKQNLLNQTMSHYTIEKRFVSSTNGAIWLNLTFSSIEGHAQYFAVILEDITENKKIYTTLVRTEEKWKTLFLNSPYLFIQLSDSGQIIYVSSAVESLLGYQPEELLGRPIKALIHPSHVNELNLALQLWSNNVQTDPIAIECWWKSKSNRWVALFIQGQPFPPSLELDGVMISGHNITPRKSLEVELRNNEEKFRSLVVNSLGAVFRCDASYMMQFTSDKIQAITGYPASVLVNNQVRSYLSIVHPDDISILKNSLMQIILNKQSHSIEYRIVHASGDIRWVGERKQGFFDQNGHLLWLDGLLLDITDRKSVEAELSRWKSKH